MTKHEENTFKVGDFVINKRSFWYTKKIGEIFFVIAFSKEISWTDITFVSSSGNLVKTAWRDCDYNGVFDILSENDNVK